MLGLAYADTLSYSAVKLFSKYPTYVITVPERHMTDGHTT